MTRVLWLVIVVSAVQCSLMSPDELEDFSNFLLQTSSLDLHVKKGADPEDAFDEEEVASDNAWEESGKFEGDLILNDRQRRLIVENVEGLARNGLTDSTKKWPNNEVVYFIQREHFNSGQVQAIQDGIDDLAQASCVKFRPYRKGDRDAVVIQGSRRGCFSQVGYQGGYQVLNLSGRHPVGRGCFRHGTVIHELLHSLGFYHMQSSPDRDDYIDVRWANIIQPARHNFRKYNSFSVSDFGVGYDYDSVLHYSRRAFSANGQDTLVPKKLGAEIGQRVGLSDKDTQKLNKMYCDDDNDHVQADDDATEKPKIIKKKPKNQPFEGHGIGYHQGKTVVIKLPAAESYKLPKVNVPSTHVFDFSKTPQIVSTPEDEGYGIGKQVTYPYNPTISLNAETITKYQNNFDVQPTLDNHFQQPRRPTGEDEQFLRENKNEHSSQSNFSDDIKPDYIPIDEHDKDLKEAFHKLTKIVKQHVYPQNHDIVHINKDYSEFYRPLKPNQSNNFKDSLDDNDTKQDKQALGNKSNDNYTNKETEDRDAFYGTSLPIKKPYSSYEQIETPHYATLEYLQGRHDFSNIYSPHLPEDYKQRDEFSSAESDKSNHDNIKINPYDQGFYTDNIKNDGKHRLTDALNGDKSKEQKQSKYKLAANLSDKQSDPVNRQLNGMDSSFRTLLPTKKPYSSYEQTDTPAYATLEYLKDRHEISGLYTAKKSDDEKRKELYTILDSEIPPSEKDWYMRDSYINPAYNRDSNSGYIQVDPKRHSKDETRARITDVPNYDEGYDDDNENSPKPRNTTEAKSYQDIYTDYENKESKESIKNDSKHNDDESDEKEANHHGENYDDGYYADYRKRDSGRLGGTPKYDNNDDERPIQEPSKKNIFNLDSVKIYPDYYTDYEKEHSGRLNYNKSTEDSSRKSQAYLLDGAPVPLTKDWYKPSYSISDASHEDKYLGSHKYDYR